MHELGIAQSIFDQMMRTAEANGIADVRKVVFKLGVLSGVEGGHLAEHLDEFAENTPFEGAEYEFIELSPGDELSPEELADSPSKQTPPEATGFEIIIHRIEGE